MRAACACLLALSLAAPVLAESPALEALLADLRHHDPLVRASAGKTIRELGTASRASGPCRS